MLSAGGAGFGAVAVESSRVVVVARSSGALQEVLTVARSSLALSVRLASRRAAPIAARPGVGGARHAV